MSVTITRVRMWHTEIPNRPGVLAATLEPLAQAGANLSVVMKYSVPGRSTRATVEILPGRGPRVTRAARAAGVQPVAYPGAAGRRETTAPVLPTR